MNNILRSLSITVVEADQRGYKVDDIYAFIQTWPNTACGWGGMGGDSMTQDLTVVIIEYLSDGNQLGHIFFGGTFAYTVEVDKIFMKDVTQHAVEGISSAITKYKVKSIYRRSAERNF